MATATRKRQVLLLPGDGIGTEITEQAAKVLNVLCKQHGLEIELLHGLIGAGAFDAVGNMLPEETLQLARACDAVLFGAVGDPRWDDQPAAERPERALLSLRAELGLFANLRPATLYPQLAAASTLKPEVIENLDLLIVRELIGGLYYGEPRGLRELDDGERQGYNTLVYRESEIERIARVAFGLAEQRRGSVCSVDKANVLESMVLWREVVERVAADFPEVSLNHLYIDNAAMQLVKAPTQFDVILAGNIFGDILSDLAAMLTGSIGMLPSASMDEDGKGLYEPVHGSAPELAGRDVANPLAMILCVAMMLRYSLGEENLAARVEAAVHGALDQGLRTPDLATPGQPTVGTGALGDAVVELL